MISIMQNKKDFIIVSGFWLILWQGLSMIINQKILLPSPILVANSLIELLLSSDTYVAIGLSTVKILFGLFATLIVGVLFSILSTQSTFFKKLINPLMLISKAVPVTSFIILVLVWVSSKNLSIVICFLMGLPVFYTNTLEGIENISIEIKEMAKVFQISTKVKIRYIYVPFVLPYFKSACMLALGLCFKAAIAAEIISLPDNSIGEHLYNSKIYLDIPKLFAWTILIVVLSFIFEKVFTYLIRYISRKLEVVSYD